MRDMHRERLTHLLANAILELWKKETGSLSSVIIEGTICITSSTGKTTVLQVADRFNGSIPEADEEADHAFSPPEVATRQRFHHPANFGVMRSLSLPQYYQEHPAPPKVDCQNQTAMAAFLDNLSPASLVSPGNEYSRGTIDRRSPPGTQREVNNNHPLDATTGVKDEGFDGGLEKSTIVVAENPTGAICAGTGYYTTQELNNNTIEVKHPLKFHKGRQCSGDRSPSGDNSAVSLSDRKRSSSEPSHIHASKSPSPSTDRQSSSEGTQGRAEVLEHTASTQASSDAMDLSQGSTDAVSSIVESVARRYADDLALSPPHSYTAQVRDIIRQRVLAAQQKGSPTSTSELEAEALAAVQRSVNDVHDGGKATPKVLESLGLHHRSDGEDTETHTTQGSIERKESGDDPAAPAPSSCSTPESAKHAMFSRKPPQGHHPLLLGAVSPIVSAAQIMTSSPTMSSPIAPSPGGAGGSNGHLHNILQQHRLFLPLPPLPRGGISSASSAPTSAPPLFTHPGFSPLALPPGQHAPRDGSPSPTDLSLDSSGEGDKEAGGEQRVYRCEFCTKTFLFKSKYHEHLPVHTNARPFQCHLCSRTYKYKYDLRVHLRTHMGIPTKSTVCPFCNTKFDTNKRLRVHIKDAHKDKQKAEEPDTPPPAQAVPQEALPPPR